MLALTILVDGITYASWLFVVALGLTLVFGVLKILNIAHGSFYAVGAYAAASLVSWFGSMGLAPEWSLLALLMAGVATAAILAPLTNADYFESSTGVMKSYSYWSPTPYS